MTKVMGGPSSLFVFFFLFKFPFIETAYLESFTKEVLLCFSEVMALNG